MCRNGPRVSFQSEQVVWGRPLSFDMSRHPDLRCIKSKKVEVSANGFVRNSYGPRENIPR